MSNSKPVSIDYDEETEEFELEQNGDTIELNDRSAREVVIALKAGLQAREKIANE